MIIWGQRLVWSEQKYGIYMPEQRAQPEYLCITASFNKVLSRDITQQTKNIAVSFDNDASGACDNMFPTQAMINCRRLGLPRSAAKMLTSILNNTIYKIRIGNGISTCIYQKLSSPHPWHRTRKLCLFIYVGSGSEPHSMVNGGYIYLF